MRRQLIELRDRMKEEGIDLYIVPTADHHGSEYVNEHFKCREYVSGFTGSAGTLVVTQDRAGLWTDGRYFIQAERQLAGSGIELMKMGQDGVPEIEEYLEGQDAITAVGFDGRVIGEALGRRLEKTFHIRYDMDLVGDIWKERPEIIPSEIRRLPPEVTGEPADRKLQRLHKAMGEADYILLSSLEETAWLYDLRGADIKHTPVFYSFALISRTEDILYVMDGKYISSQSAHDPRHKVKAYGRIYEDLRTLKNCTVMLDKRTASFSLYKCFDPSVELIIEKSPVELFKAVKNEREIEATRQAHIRDGAAVTEFIYRLKRDIPEKRITEQTAADDLEACRRKRGAYDLSFATIAGYEGNGAIIHYAVTPKTDRELRPAGFLLVDSGGQYEDGTTDITRTIALGPLDRERKEHYTAVLKGHIALARSKFGADTTGAELDAVARKPLQDMGLDYGHGTGHGVGHMLSVHEGPNTISKRGTDSHILPGMITSDEPGVYLEDRYGIRIENELLCIDQGENYGFQALTLCPYERDAIEPELLSREEIDYIDRYHEKVYETLKDILDDDVREWLKSVCRKLKNTYKE